MDNESIQSRIYRIRGRQVMIDNDLAYLYHVRVKVLNQSVRRNIRRFPLEFMFQLSIFEAQAIRSQFVTASKRNVRYCPLVFTEHGIAMLSSVLKSERAIQTNIAIIKTFIKLRHAILSNRDIARRVEKLEGDVHIAKTDIRLVQEDVKQLRKRSIPPDLIPPTII